ncbi:8382_t:CDS:2 [Ambispora gerdemannii]|uniref:Adenosine kinase n=1 Tax=Ambispora gerdemannii TaxID=144530 RepID=A0A9N8VCF0_9GLOM|nr:8382_t:CDS:2 [Ambispora gerdemannii]
MVKKYILFVMGNPLLDIQVKADENLLEKYGLKPNDSILAEEKHMPLYVEIVKNYKPTYVAGGAAQNTARGAQYLLPPNATIYVGCVGNDHLGKQLRMAAEKDGLCVEYMVVDDVATGTCAALLTDHKRSLVANLSAAEKYQLSDLKSPEKWKHVENAEYFYISGFFLTVSVPSALEVAKHASEKNKVFSMNLSAPFLAQFFTKDLDALSPYWDLIFGNENEAEAFAKAHAWEHEEIKQIALAIAQLPKINTKRQRVVVITQGADPTIVAYPDGTIKEYPVIAIADDEIVDTNGAGDAFVGGFLSQYVQGKSIEESVAAGHWLANINVKQIGATYPEEKIAFVPK